MFYIYVYAWEQRKFNELAEVKRGLTYNPSYIRENGVRVLRSSNIDEDTFILKSDDVFVDSKAINIDFVKENDILITSANGSSRLVGKHALIKKIADKEAVHGGFMLVARANEPEFLNAIMSSAWYEKFINVFVSGGNGAIGNLSKHDLEIQSLYVPSLAEQHVIGEFFKQLDNLITLHQRKLDKIKQLKHILLRQMFPQNGEDIPRTRFSDFDKKWEKRFFSEIFDLSVSNNTLSRANLNYAKGEIKNIHYGDILIKFDSILNVNNDIIPFITNAKVIDYKNQLLKNGDIIIADTAEDKTVGKAIEITGIQDNYVVSGLHTIVARPKINFAPNYLGFYMNSAPYRYQLFPLMQGVKVLSLSKTNISKTTISYPTNIEEQEKIGSLFYNIDNITKLQDKILDKLGNFKKACLKKMFL